MYKFKFADIGEGLHEGVVGEIYKKEGDMVKEGDSLFSVETDKVTSDIPSPVDGKIAKVLMIEGDTIHVGSIIYHIDDGSSTSATEEVVDQKPKEEKATNNELPTAQNTNENKDVFQEVKSENNSNLTPRMTHINNIVNDKQEPITEKPVNQNVDSSKQEISSLALAIAKDANVDITKITGTGIHNRIMKDDVLNYINKNMTTASTDVAKISTPNKSVPVSDTSAPVSDKRVKVTNLRKTIAKVMKNS
jgi:pyruvate/2-oxoglutarate dehydrogenase complex dihydrolipoamide acyltransferase (E2) component